MIRLNDSKEEWTGVNVQAKEFELRHPHDNVRAFFDREAFRKSNPPQDTFLAPNYPAQVTLTAPTAASTQLTPTWTTSTGATGYKLYWSNLEFLDEGAQVIDVGDVLTYDHTGLESGRAYYYKVVPYNATLDGVLSNEVSGRPD